VRLPDFVRTTTFRWTLAVAGAFVLCTVVLFGFVYWQTAAYMTSTFDALLTGELQIIAADSPERRLTQIDNRLHNDPRRVRITGLFAADGHRITGNLESVPAGLVPDVPANATIVRLDNGSREREKARLVSRPLQSGEVLVIGRNVDEISQIADIVRRGLVLGLLPALGLALVIGWVLISRAQDRLSEVNRKIQRIATGDLRERLPTHGGNDPFD
jgi:methyl-accepting chemotaxis protein